MLGSLDTIYSQVCQFYSLFSVRSTSKDILTSQGGTAPTLALEIVLWLSRQNRSLKINKDRHRLRRF